MLENGLRRVPGNRHLRLALTDIAVRGRGVEALRRASGCCSRRTGATPRFPLRGDRERACVAFDRFAA